MPPSIIVSRKKHQSNICSANAHYGQFDSPYLAMGNNPVMFVDPDGGKIGDWEDPNEPEPDLRGSRLFWSKGKGGGDPTGHSWDFGDNSFDMEPMILASGPHGGVGGSIASVSSWLPINPETRERMNFIEYEAREKAKALEADANDRQTLSIIAEVERRELLLTYEGGNQGARTKEGHIMKNAKLDDFVNEIYSHTRDNWDSDDYYELSGFAMKNKKTGKTEYYINPTEYNDAITSNNDWDKMKKTHTILFQLHSHTQFPPGPGDATVFRDQNFIPIYSVTHSGDIWKVSLSTSDGVTFGTKMKGGVKNATQIFSQYGIKK